MAPLPPSNPFFTPPALPSNYQVHHLTVASAHQISARTKSALSLLYSSPESSTKEKESSSAQQNQIGKKLATDKNANPKDQVTIVALTAPNPKAANKLISIVEIVKREVAARRKASGEGSAGDAKGKGWWQYTQLKSVVRDVPREVKRKGLKGADVSATGKAQDGEEDDDDEEDAFETMPAAKVTAKRKRDGKDAEEEDGRDSTLKKRAMPVLTIYLSTAPVRELKMALGEQT